MTTLVSLLAAMVAAPACPAPVGTPVTITSTVLPLKTIGGTYRLGNGWPAPGDARIGAVQYACGLLLRSDDPRFVDFDFSPGPVHSRSSGCWFEWENRWGKHGVEAIGEPHIGESIYRAGYTPEQPTNPPVLPGYRFISAAGASSPDYTWVGLWNATDSRARSRVVVFDDHRHKTLAALPFRLGGITTLPSPDTPALGITIIGEGKDRGPVPYFQLLWMSDIPEARETKDRP